MKIENDIIAGISTPFAKGAISIIRLSGKGCIELINKIFKGTNLNKVASHTIHYGHIFDLRNNEVIDEVLVSVFLAPKTYTKEDVVEINCHGGIFITNMIYENIIDLGARPAEPGEFTKRAFLNGRIDLTKAEAVMDVIDAENKIAVKLANQGINGEIFELVKKYRNRLLDIIATISVNIDYPEYDDVEELTNELIFPSINNLISEMEILLNNSIGCKYLKEGINTLIIGKPNVGKSTLLNALTKEEKAIVTNIPGTTRDVIEAKVNLGNITLNLIDTAGIRNTTDLVEKIGVEKSIEKIKTADLILLILDSTTLLTEDEIKLMSEISNKPHFIIVNKCDILGQKNIEYELKDAIYISAHNKKDVEQLEKEIKDKIIKEIDTTSNLIYLGNSRQISKLKLALESLNEALETINKKDYIDFVDIYLREAYNYLGEIIGETSTDTLLNELFSKFCLGK